MNRSFQSEKGSRVLPLALVTIVVLSGALFLYRSWQPGAERDAARETSPAPAIGPRGSSTVPPFSLMDVNGNVYSSTLFAGKPTVINFFATWCPPCREEIPGFVEVYKRHKEQGFELIGISLDTETRENLPGFLATHRIDYRILLGDLDTARVFGGVTSIPTTFFVGKDGRIMNVLMGYIGKEEFDREVRKLL
ncbi:MAG: TlpA family protein disulfide reductase [Deltaproteobacteria bacterium]|nr:TlpA family protein disulfide reductase [Deltaproteobacteria bacterium]